MITKVTKRSHAKVILIGEHSVVYGQPAIALPLTDLKMSVKVKPLPNHQLIQNMDFSGPVAKMPSYMRGPQHLILAILRRFGARQAGLSIKITKNFPAGRGMGSSAAVAVAITRAMYAYFNQPLNHKQLMSTSNIEEKITHGNPSGIDTATTSLKRPVWFVSGRPALTFSLNLTGDLVIADSGSAGSTNVAVDLVKRELQTHPNFYRPKIKKLGKLATAAKHAIANGRINSLGVEMNRAQQQLSQLGVSNSRLDTLVAAARAHGAKGAKLTGSGLGGCIIALTANDAVAKQASRALLKAGAAHTWLQRFGSK